MNRVFLVDDEKYVLRSFIASIDWDAEGFVIVGQSTDGQEAIQSILELTPDLVFVDIRMPDIGGLEIIRQVRQANPGIHFAVVSGHNEFSYAQEAMRYGALDYCLKPFNRTEINQVLRRAKQLVADREKQNPSSKKATDPPANPDIKTRNQTLKKILLDIHQNYKSNLSIEQIAKQYSLNQNYISQLFKRETGKTFTEYVMELRIEYANQLLQKTNFPISEIAEMVGYADYFYFARVYKKTTGITPSQYRQKSSEG